MKYRPEIDGLRTLAVIPVILFHGGFALFSGGFVGVDVFFVISGYLITTIIISELAAGRFSLASFYERRARRILPALFFVMAMCTPIAWMLMLPGELQDYAQSVIAVATFSSNFLFWLESGYFDVAAELKPLLHTWSLAVEEQYYILFPLFLLLTWRLGQRQILLLLLVVFVASLALAQWGAHASPDAAFFLLPTRGWELLIGVFAAFYLWQRGHVQSQVVNQLGGLTGLLLILFAVFWFDETTPFPGIFALVPTIGTALLILFAVPGTWVNGLLSLRWMVTLGLLSYSAYLWHQPLLVFSRLATAENPPLSLLVLACVSAFVLAAVSYKFVETPFRNRNFLVRKQVLGASVVTMFLFVSAGTLMPRVDAALMRYQTHGFSGDTGHAVFHEYVENNHLHCEPAALFARAETWDGFVRCHQSLPEPPKVVVFGDSHAEHFFVGLAEQLADVGVVYLIHGGYPFVGEPEFDPLIDYINANPDIEYVIYGGYWYRTTTALGTERFAENLNATIAAFKRAGKQVVLISDVPDFGFEPTNCNFSNQFRSSVCDIPVAEFDQQRHTYAAVFADIAETNAAEVINIDDVLCTSQLCSMVQNNVILYRDNDHLNLPGSRMAGQAILQRSHVLAPLLE